MFDKHLNQDSIRRDLEPVISTFEETVVPSMVELLPNNAYTQQYAWMYSFEKRLKYRIQDILGHPLSYAQEKMLFGPGGVVSEGLSNGFVHGHKKDVNLGLSVWVAVSHKGLGFALTDQGLGFDFDSIFSRFRSKGSFFHIAGNGFSLFYRIEHVTASYQKNGTQLCLLCPLSLD